MVLVKPVRFPQGGPLDMTPARRPRQGESMRLQRDRFRRGVAIAAALGLLMTTSATSTALAKTTKKKAKKKAAVVKKTTAKKNAAATPATPGAAAPGWQKGTVKIGLLYAGINSTSGAQTTKEDYKIGKVWADDVNAAGGINGYKVELLAKDTLGDTARTLQAVKDLDKAGVIAFAGSNVGPQYAAISSYLNQKTIPYIGGLSSYDETRFDPMNFPTSATNAGLRYGAIPAAHDAGAKSWFLAYCTENPNCATGIPTYRYTAAREGVKMFLQAASAVAPDYTSVCLAAKNAGAEFLQVNGINFANTVRDCQRQDYHPIYANGGSVTQAIV